MTEVWLTVEDICSLTGEIKETVRRKCKSGKYISKFVKNGKYKIYSILLSSLDNKYQNLYSQNKNTDVEQLEQNSKDYASAPVWARQQADKYLKLISLTGGMKPAQIKEFLRDWNVKNPDKCSSYTRLFEARKKYNQFGVSALLSKKGRQNCRYSINKDYFEYYKSLYLKEGAPSANSCWLITLGYAKQKDNINPIDFPTCRTFDRYLKSQVPEQAIYLARYGLSAWNKKYASYISRDYSELKAGTCWVSDHAQIDVAVSFEGTVCFPWVTVFRDVKTSKWLGWFLHAEAPNSDHIFQAFYYGVQKYGLPTDVYLDNGKDYRCKDFAGGRIQSVKVEHSNTRENSLMKNVGITVHFALPYNAQTKPVERDFLKIKTFLSKHFIGYRGGKITERPEKLRNEIKNNKIMQYGDFKLLFDDFIENFLNKKPSKSKVLQGKSPDEAWCNEFTVKRVISKDALKLFCMRTSKNVSIGRNGVYDSQLQLTYWDEWMIAEKGRKVYLRRDINAYQEAWVFDAVTDEFLGKANVNQAVSFLASTNVQKAEYKKAIEAKNKEKKILKNYIQCKYSPTNTEIITNLKNGLDNKTLESNPIVSEISNTLMDQVVTSEKKTTKTLKYIPAQITKKKIYLTESEKRRDQERVAI